MRNKLRIHFNRRNFINFIIIINEINKVIIKKFKKRYLKIKNLVVALKFEKFLILNKYYVK